MTASHASATDADGITHRVWVVRDDEIVILNGVLELNTKRVTEIMTPMKDVVTLGMDTVLDHDMVDRMYVHNAILRYTDGLFINCPEL